MLLSHVNQWVYVTVITLCLEHVINIYPAQLTVVAALPFAWIQTNLFPVHRAIKIKSSYHLTYAHVDGEQTGWCCQRAEEATKS